MISIIFAAGIQALSSPFAPAESPVPEPVLSVTEETVHFDVPGAGLEAFHNNVDRFGPGGRLSALDYQYRLSMQSHVAGETCNRLEPQVDLELIYRLPRWAHSERASLRERAAFDALRDRERDLLEDRAVRIRRAMVWMIDDLRSLEPQDCDVMADSVDAVSEVWRDVIDAAMAPEVSGVRVVALRDEVCRRTGSVLARCQDD